MFTQADFRASDIEKPFFLTNCQANDITSCKNSL
ncbi:hypothetical protein M085_4494, partial [Bacteroides fragilis str. 3986 N(B)19]